MANNKNMAICGLDCGSCPAFIATKNNDSELRIKTGKGKNRILNSGYIIDNTVKLTAADIEKYLDYLNANGIE